VKISSQCDDSNLRDKVGEIRNIHGAICNVFIMEDNRVASVRGEFLDPITPEKGDRVSSIRYQAPTIVEHVQISIGALCKFWHLRSLVDQMVRK